MKKINLPFLSKFRKISIADKGTACSPNAWIDACALNLKEKKEKKGEKKRRRRRIEIRNTRRRM